MLQTFSITVTGKVQGVFYRQSTKEKATELGINGTVMNKPDGSVELTITTTEELADAMEAWCKSGPPRARVEKVERKPAPYKVFNSFTILR